MRLKDIVTSLTVPPRALLLEEGKNITFQFFFEGDFLASFDSILKSQPCLFSLESIEYPELLSLEREDFFRLIDIYPGLRQRYEEKLTDRIRSYQLLFLSRIKKSAAALYRVLFRNHPVSLSRIRNRK